MMNHNRLPAYSLFFLTFLAGFPAFAVNPLLPDRFLGKADAPITIEEYVSLTCSHCAEFYNTTLPELEKKYVETGKVRFVLRDFPLDGIALTAAALARCMPEDEYYPFVKTLYSTQKTWLVSEDAAKAIAQYARLGGLSQEKIDSCVKDTKLMDAIVSERTDAGQKVKIEATPTFVLNGGAEVIRGAMPLDEFTKVIDRLLAAKK